MSVYRNTCGTFTIDVSEPWPMWVKITGGHHQVEMYGFTSADLYDLRHLIDRAIIAAEERENKSP